MVSIRLKTTTFVVLGGSPFIFMTYFVELSDTCGSKTLSYKITSFNIDHWRTVMQQTGDVQFGWSSSSLPDSSSLSESAKSALLWLDTLLFRYWNITFKLNQFFILLFPINIWFFTNVKVTYCLWWIFFCCCFWKSIPTKFETLMEKIGLIFRNTHTCWRIDRRTWDIAAFVVVAPRTFCCFRFVKLNKLLELRIVQQLQ